MHRLFVDFSSLNRRRLLRASMSFLRRFWSSDFESGLMRAETGFRYDLLSNYNFETLSNTPNNVITKSHFDAVSAFFFRTFFSLKYTILICSCARKLIQRHMKEHFKTDAIKNLYVDLIFARSAYVLIKIVGVRSFLRLTYQSLTRLLRSSCNMGGQLS